VNADEFEAKWKHLKGAVKQRWAQLTDDEVMGLSGRKDELVGTVQERYGITQEQATHETDTWARAMSAELDGSAAGIGSGSITHPEL